MNTLLNIAMITREALRVLENNLTFTNRISRQYDSKFAVEGAKIGTVLNVRKPPRYLGRTGQALALEDATETQVPVELDTQAGVDIEFSSQDLALSIDDFSARFIKPAVSSIANRIDFDGLALFKTVFSMSGAVGTVPTGATAFNTYLGAGQKLDDSACPMDGDRCIVLPPNFQVEIVDSLKGLFQQSTQIAEQYIRGQMGMAAGFDWYMDQNINSRTLGTFTTGSTPIVAGAGQSGSSLATSGWAVSTLVLTEGDLFTLPAVNKVNPQNRQSVGELQQFVATADVTSDGAGLATIPLSPAITPAGAFQTVDASPANAVAVTPLGTEGATVRVPLAFHRDAFTLATADLPLPRGVDMAARVSDAQLGISLRMVRAYDINQDAFPCRLDVLYGWSALRPELACRIAG